MPNGYLPPEMYMNVVEFLRGTPEHRKQKNAADKIARWYQKHKHIDEYTKSGMVRQIIWSYDDETLLNYPTFANSKMALYSPTRYPVREFNSRSQVRNWIVEHMTVKDITLVGL